MVKGWVMLGYVSFTVMFAAVTTSRWVGPEGSGAFGHSLHHRGAPHPGWDAVGDQEMLHLVGA